MMDKSWYFLVSAFIVLAATPAASQLPPQKPQPCAQSSQSVPPGNSADNPPDEQGVEHSAIVPSAGGTDQSAAPTVKKNGQDVIADTGCPKEPNRLKSTH
jgi:hypothetical protein